ncbi:hypothetical protein F2Q69_00053858 [Brassica cretica]|uniref:Uncharacterized protein n=1 Tax=Brassica cretica TaxID=69181 RepID=A0A8S9N2D4_BRACR|nr:hypothetical protein F2Q69_00053858 [Brassica cretica]
MAILVTSSPSSSSPIDPGGASDNRVSNRETPQSQLIVQVVPSKTTDIKKNRARSRSRRRSRSRARAKARALSSPPEVIPVEVSSLQTEESLDLAAKEMGEGETQLEEGEISEESGAGVKNGDEDGKTARLRQILRFSLLDLGSQLSSFDLENESIDVT